MQPAYRGVCGTVWKYIKVVCTGDVKQSSWFIVTGWLKEGSASLLCQHYPVCKAWNFHRHLS